MHREDNNYNDEGLILSLHTAYRLIWPCVLHTKLKQHWCFNFSISIQFPCDAHVVNLYLVEFYLSAFCVVVAVMVEHFVELVFCFMVCVVEVCLVFFLHLTLVSFVPWFVLSKLSCCFGLTLKMRSFVLLCWFMVCVFLLLWKIDLLGLFCLLVCDFSLRGRFCLILIVHCVESC